MRVPDVLLSGNHAEIAAWRKEQSRRRTLARRPDLAAPERPPLGHGRTGQVGSGQGSDRSVERP